MEQIFIAAVSVDPALRVEEIWALWLLLCPNAILDVALRLDLRCSSSKKTSRSRHSVLVVT
jgi:hypothetical protein